MKERTLRVLEFYKIRDMLIDLAASEPGKELVRNLLPIKEAEEIYIMQSETDEAFNIIIKRGNPPLGGFYCTKGDIKRCELGANLGAGSLLKIGSNLRVARRFKSFIKDNKGDRESNYPLIEEFVGSLTPYKELEERIFESIISEDEISDNASTTLKNIRKQKQLKNESIRNKLNSIIGSSTKKKYLQESLITIRGDRFVVPVKAEYKGSFPGLVHDQSSSGATLFIEPMEIVNLNNELKELHAEELKEIERILAELTALVSYEIENIKTNQVILTNLDFIFAKGKLASKMNAVKPIINNDGIIDIKKGRHPLINPKDVVPTDIYIGKEFNTLVITGPNTGGKTVTLKTTGLLTLMAQAGLHVPANHGTIISVFDNVFADIGDEQSIEQSLSTFSSHMTNIVDILKTFTNKSLILFDELGAGTDPTEGAALAISILDYLRINKIRTIATTHYSELKIYAITTDGVENASVEFDVQTLSPTYRLLIGIPGKSNAFEISKKLGLQSFIIESAKSALSKETIAFEDVLANIEIDRKKANENREEAEKFKQEISKLKEELIIKQRKIDDIREKAIKEAKLEAKKILRDAKEEADNIIKEIRNISVEIEKEKNKKIEESKNRLKNKLNKIESELSENILNKTNSKPPKSLKIGDAVEVISLNQKGTVVTEPDGSGNLTVQIGIMKVNVNIKTLRKTEDEETIKVQASTKKIINSKTRNIKNEIDLRGLSLDEALLDVDKYLDDAYLSSLNTVTIIHGKGTGILREGIKQLLKGHKHVKSQRLGEFSEGGTGVTVVELK